MVSTTLPQKIVKAIETLVKQLAKEYSSETARECGNTQRGTDLGNHYLLVRDILWLSYGIDIRKIHPNESIEVSDDVADNHFLSVLKDYLNPCENGGVSKPQGEEKQTHKALDDVYYSAEITPRERSDVDNFILRSIRENGAYSLRKARELVGKRYTNKTIISNNDVFLTLKDCVHTAYHDQRKTKNGLLTISELVGIKRELDIFSDFYVPGSVVDEYLTNLTNDEEREVERETKEKRESIGKVKSEMYNKLWNGITMNGREIRVRNLNRATFENSMRKFADGETTLDGYLPEESRRLRSLLKEIKETTDRINQKYQTLADLARASIETERGEQFFSSAKAKTLTNENRLLFTLFTGVQECYTR